MAEIVYEYLASVISADGLTVINAAQKPLTQIQVAQYEALQNTLAGNGEKLHVVKQLEGTGLPVDWPAPYEIPTSGGSGGSGGTGGDGDTELIIDLGDISNTWLTLGGAQRPNWLSPRWVDANTGIFSGGGWFNTAFPMDMWNTNLVTAPNGNSMFRICFYSPVAGSYQLLADGPTEQYIVGCRVVDYNTQNGMQTDLGTVSTPIRQALGAFRDLDMGYTKALARGLNTIYFRADGGSSQNDIMGLKRLIWRKVV